MSITKLLKVPQIGVNDKSADVVEWKAEEGCYVSRGDIVCVIETTKAILDVQAENSGYLGKLVKESDKVLIGDNLAVIGETLEDAQKYKQTHMRMLAQDEDGDKSKFKKATMKALKLAETYGVQLEDIMQTTGLDDNKILTAHQPLYLPWIGLFHKIALSDQYCVFDEVQYQKRDFHNRNKIRNKTGELMLTVPVESKNHFQKKVGTVKIVQNGWQRKHIKSIQFAYMNSKYFDRYFPELEKILMEASKNNLGDLNYALLQYFMDCLKINIPIIRASDCDFHGEKSDLVLNMCTQLGAKYYVFGEQGVNYANVEKFRRKGIELCFQKYNHPKYQQTFKGFLPNLSVIDLIFNEGPESMKIIMSGNISKTDIMDDLGGKIIKESDVLKYVNKTINSNKKIESVISIPDKYVPVVIYGAGKGGITILEALSLGEHYRAVCFVDDNRSNVEPIEGLPVFHSQNLIELKVRGVLHVATEIMDGKVRLKIKKKIEDFGLELINIIHPTAFVAPSVTMGQGNYIKAGAIVETNTKIGNCCIIDNGVVIAHDNIIEDGCHLAPGASIASSVRIEEGTIIGVGANISNNLKIGRNCIISVGASITTDIGKNSVIAQTPSAKIGAKN
jgi:sugar O-acyltransferase (sialic acid O-acetyltransferase NeuD family)